MEVREVVDCRERKIIDYHSSGRLTKVAKTGEIEHATMSESRFSASTDMYAKMLVIPEKCIINDDLGVFNEIGQMWGEMYICSRDIAFYQMLMNEFTWKTDCNILQGADATFCPDALDWADDMYVNQIDRGGKPIQVSGRHWLGQAGSMERRVRSYNTSSEIKPTNPSDKPEPCENPWQGYFSTICGTPRFTTPQLWADEALPASKLTKGNYKTGADKLWFIFPDPSRHASIRLTYLQGYRIPRVDFAPTAFNTLGMQSRVVAAYGFDQVCNEGPIAMDPDNCLTAV